MTLFKLPFSLPRLRPPEAYNRLTTRERKLLLFVVGALFVVVNLLVVRGLLTSINELRAKWSARSMTATASKAMLSQSALWTKRDAWLNEKQPVIGAGRDRASIDLLNDLETLTRNNGLLLDAPPVINPAEKPGVDPAFQSVSVSIDTKGTWAAVARFLHTVQQPERFIVFESATVQTDPSDSNLLRGKFRIAKWYKP
ncbi:hypothetical protein AYO41_04605 [Verrucomicrobia bacterium SCGC AG-212-E04]|nr:hypothetical protein AYO41_04605 [Verrucomicrobia bacterium SCGC AG-212-E04]